VPSLRHEPAALDDDQASRTVLALEDGAQYRIYNRAKLNSRWQEVPPAEASRRVFVSSAGERFVYVFRRGDDRSVLPRTDELVRQLEIARTRKAKTARASIEWSGAKLYFTTADGHVYRVHDGWYKNKRHVNVKPGTGFPPSRWFVPANKTEWIRVFHFTNHDEREISVAALEQQFTRTHFLANKHRAASHPSDWKKHLKAEQLR
jgi:hypothetical protein